MVNVPNRLELPYMSYPTKTYKVKPFYKVAFDSIFDVLSNQKSPFLEWIMDKHFGTETTNALSQHNFNGLFIEMIQSLEVALEETDFENLSNQLKSHSKFIELYSKYPDTSYLRNGQTIFTVRISNQEISRVQGLKHGYSLKDVVQLAILNYLVNLDDSTYELVKETFFKSIEN